MNAENYGVFLTPHFEKYQVQDEKTADLMQATWNFGNKLKGQRYTVAYMHGPVCMYEGIIIQANNVEFKTKDHDKEFMAVFPKEYIYFLFQKAKKNLRFACILKEEIKIIRQQRLEEKPQRRKSKKGAKNVSTQDQDREAAQPTE